MQSKGRSAVVRQGHCVVAILGVVVVAVLCLSPAYAKPPPGDIPDDDAYRGDGPDFVKVKAGTPVTVLGLMKPGTRPCPECVTYAVVQLPNADVVSLDPKDINYQTNRMRVDTEASGPYPPEHLKEFRWLPGTGGAALLPLLGAVTLVGSGLVLRRLLN
jgi:hypothetical protein